MRQSQEFSPSLSRMRKAAIASALLLGAALFAGSIPARAGMYDGGGGPAGGDRSNDYGADHDEVYQLVRGDLVCHSREACGGAAAIPMNRPGWFYLPRGMYLAQHPVVPTRPQRHKN